MFNKAKDLAISKAAQVALNRYISDFGKLLSLRLDSKHKSIALEIMLDGESEPLSVSIAHYKLYEEKGHFRLSVRGITTSRRWLDTVAASYLEGKTFEVPDAYAKIAKQAQNNALLTKEIKVNNQ